MPTFSGVPLSQRQRKLIGSKLKKHGARTELGRRVGCTGEHIGVVIKGTKNPSGELLKKICDELGLELRVGRTTIDGVE